MLRFRQGFQETPIGEACNDLLVQLELVLEFSDFGVSLVQPLLQSRRHRVAQGRVVAAEGVEGCVDVVRYVGAADLSAEGDDSFPKPSPRLAAVDIVICFFVFLCPILVVSLHAISDAPLKLR